MFSKGLKRFDVYVKTKDYVLQSTYLGATMTLLGAVVVIVLLFSEFTAYMQKDVVSRMVADSTVGVEFVKLDFDVEFLKIGCDKLTFAQEVTRGTLHTHEPENVQKETLHREDGSAGCWIKGSIVTDKLDGNFRFVVTPDEALAQAMASRGLAGGPSLVLGNINLIGAQEQKKPKLTPPDLAHKINYIKFQPADGNSAESHHVPGLTEGLHDVTTEVAPGTGLYHYAIRIVPTHYNPLKGAKLHANQYSVTERQVDVENMLQGISILGQSFSGISVVFAYDFYPVMLVMEERKEGLFEFLASLCGIVGGVITVIGMIEGCLQSATKAAIGKKD